MMHFYISRTTDVFELKFSPVIGIDNTILCAKFQFGHLSGRYFTDPALKWDIPVYKIQPDRWPTWNFAHRLISSIPITGVNFKSKAPVVLEIQNSIICILQTRSVNYTIWVKTKIFGQISQKAIKIGILAKIQHF